MEIKKGTVVFRKESNLPPLHCLWLVTGKPSHGHGFKAKDVEGVDLEIRGKLVPLVQTDGKVRSVKEALRKHYLGVIKNLIGLI